MTGSPAGSTAPHPDPPPVTAQGDVLLIPLREDLHEGTAERLQRDVIHRIAHSPAPGDAVVIDISGVEVVGSFLGPGPAEITDGARLLATRTVPAGMRPAVAITLVQPSPTLPGPVAAPDVDMAQPPVREAPPAIPPAHPEGGA